MSHIYNKIKYNETGSYGSTEEKYLYIHANLSIDRTGLYDDKGNFILSFDDTLDNNILEAFVKYNNNNKDVERIHFAEFDKIFDKDETDNI